MKKVYLVCRSGWEHHAIVAAFTTQKKAENFLKKCPKWTEDSYESFYIEDYDLDKRNIKV